MEEQEMKQIMITSVSLTVKHLNNNELAVLNMVAQLDMDPHGRLFNYEKVEGLFTNDGVTMHRETKMALAAIVNQRLAE